MQLPDGSTIKAFTPEATGGAWIDLTDGKRFWHPKPTRTRGTIPVTVEHGSGGGKWKTYLAEIEDFERRWKPHGFKLIESGSPVVASG